LSVKLKNAPYTNADLCAIFYLYRSTDRSHGTEPIPYCFVHVVNYWQLCIKHRVIVVKNKESI